MREYAVDASFTVPPTASIADAVFDNARSDPDSVVFSRPEGSGWSPVTARQFADDVRAVARGLLAEGVGPGDRVGLMSRTRYEWTLCDYAIWTAGAVTVPIYETSSAEQVGWILSDSGAVACITETAEHDATVAQVRHQLPDVVTVRGIDTGGLDDLRAAGADVPEGDLDSRRAGITADSLATIIYTSGTTGRPKGCELTHYNLLFEVTSATTSMPQLFRESGSTLLFLPLAHVFARVIQCGCVATRATMGHTADIKNLLPALGTFSPTFLLAVPRVFEKVYNGSQQKAQASGKGKIFDAADRAAVAYSQALDAGGPNLLQKAQHAVFDRLVYSKLRAAMGGRVEYAVSGSAPLGPRLGHFFRGIGVTILEGYGLTETTAGATLNLPDVLRIGTVGRPLPGTAARIGEDGEVLLRGGHVFRGYWRNEAATAEAMTEDGWLRTGDLGRLDDDGYLAITGRKKEILVTAGGKNVSPAVLEDRLRAHPLVSQCMVVGDQRPFIACLVTLDADALPAWLGGHGKDPATPVTALVDDAALRAEIDGAVAAANQAVSKAESIRSYRILPVDFTEGGGHLTPSLKLKRAAVMKEFEADVAAIYSR